MTSMKRSLAAQQSPSRRQDSSIQALRGVAVIMLVAFHVIGSPNRGLRVPEDSFWHLGTLALQDIRMPLFTLISGYVYAMMPISQWRDYPKLMKGKSRRLLLPLLTVGAIFYLLGRSVPGTNFDQQNAAFWRVYVYGFEHLWFLQSILIIFIVVGLLDVTGRLGTRSRWIAATLLAAVLAVIVSVPPWFDIFSIDGAIKLLPFFLLGYGLRRYRVLDLRGVWAAALLGVFIAMYVIRLMNLFGYLHLSLYIGKALGVLVGAAGIVLLYSVRNVINVRILAWIGGFSYGIYLLHVLATSGTRMFLERIGVHTNWELFMIGLFMGIAAPIAFQLLFRNVGFVRTFVLGERGFTLPPFIQRFAGRPVRTSEPRPPQD